MISTSRNVGWLFALSTTMIFISFMSFLDAKPQSEAFRDCSRSRSNFERAVEMQGAGFSMEVNDATAAATASILEELESRLSRLERRLRAVEQPVWQMGSNQEDWEICAGGPCRCQPETKSVSCWRQDLLDLPAAQLVPKDVLKLDLGGNRLTALHKDSFLDMTRLNHLDLSDNSIEHLPLNLFFSLHAVTHVRLSKNSLRELHRSQFFSTRNLRILDASSNRLRTLPDSVFLTTTSLVLLDLSCNRISSLTSGTFRGLSTLEELLLGKNRLSSIPVDMFADLTSLEYLGLEENRLRELPDGLFGAQSWLRELNARGNQLSEISGNLLAPLERLRSLEMSNNKIARIDSSAFRGLIALKELQLGHNRIGNLTAGMFSRSVSLERLVLYANGIERLPRGAFRGLSNLTSLFLHSNRLRIMDPELFRDTPNLRKLQLESNYLSSLPSRILDPVPYIEQLRLARNPWHCDCASAYLAMWLQKRYLARANDTTSSATGLEGEKLEVWEFGAGAVCRGPGTLGGKLLLRLTFHELCEGQWASMRGLVPRLPIDLIGAGAPRPATDRPSSDRSVSRQVASSRVVCPTGSRDAKNFSTRHEASRDIAIGQTSEPTDAAKESKSNRRGGTALLRPRLCLRFGHSLREVMDGPLSNGRAIELLKRLLRILEEENVFDRTGDQPVLRFLHPTELQKRLAIELTEEPASGQEIETAIRQTIRYSVKTSSPHFHNQLYAGVDKYGLAGSWLTEVFNTSQYTYEVAPVFSLMEVQTIEKCLELVGYPPMPEGDGILCPGGSISNMYGMVMARYKMVPEVKTKGMAGVPPLACFTSEAGHYSITKGAHWLGLGTDHVYKVETDQLGRMRPDRLKAAIARARELGHLPFFVNATSGTTVLGAFDPLPEIGEICRQENLWLHVDACLGGTLLLSEKYRSRLKGIELSNSVAWNPHKMLGAPLQCSLFLVKGKNALHQTNCAGASYLFQQDKNYDVSWDTGDKSLQCGRKVDAAKLWLMWKARGSRGLGESVEQAMSMAEYFFERIKDRQGFRLVLPRYEGCNVCFWYVPPSMRDQRETTDWWNKLYETTTKIKERMMTEGSLMIGYTPLSYANVGNFFRMVVTCQPPPTKASMDYAIERIERLAADM